MVGSVRVEPFHSDEITNVIETRLSGQVRYLRVELFPDGRVVVHGRTSTYRAKQLVARAVIELLEGFAIVVDDVDVC